jgi:lambda repressor-like predicted transcriptional regulator
MTEMSINTSAVASLFGGQTSRPQSPLKAAAGVLGMSVTDLSAELKTGKSLNDVAKEKGVSTDTLQNALVKNMPQSLQDSGKAAQIAQKMAAQVGGPHGHHGQHKSDNDGDNDASGSSTSSASSTSLLNSLSSLLKTDPTSLKAALSSGTSLSDLLTQNNVSLSSLANTVQEGVLFDAKA